MSDLYIMRIFLVFLFKAIIKNTVGSRNVLIGRYPPCLCAFARGILRSVFVKVNMYD